MARHTPGPWKIDGVKDDPERNVIIRDATGWQVALTRHFGVLETVANAKLIAAAPEMLEALEAAISFVAEFSGPKTDKLKTKITAAIAKAEGK
jgi:hypothetical protein